MSGIKCKVVILGGLLLIGFSLSAQEYTKAIAKELKVVGLMNSIRL